ncbi:unnamed protein product [Phytophthora fragariaefolia]|uniref:Unnamed protein product n=1 Tax=Phytophthora fragariaefolia TaxID=1490495 RepID=A0A9W7CJS8_9STRA|nr:unnamed protein product [Phytophthora fragariaefolia]
MKLSSLQFKVHHKPGTAMGHIEGLSRLPTITVAAITMRDLLNPEATVDDVLPPSVGVPTAQFVRTQHKVPWIRVLVEFLVDGALPMDPYLRSTIAKMRSRHVVEDGLLIRQVNLPARVGPSRSLSVPVVPLPHIETILHYCHSDVLDYHLGFMKKLEKIQRHAFWPGWFKDVGEYVRECNRCGGGKDSRPWSAGLMQRMLVFDLTGPFSLFVVDAVGPIPETDRRNKHILVFMDYFTRWAEALAVDHLDSVTFVEVMVNGVVARHGIPSHLLSGNGRNFTSEIARSFYQTLEIKKLFGSVEECPRKNLRVQFFFHKTAAICTLTATDIFPGFA